MSEAEYRHNFFFEIPPLCIARSDQDVVAAFVNDYGAALLRTDDAARVGEQLKITFLENSEMKYNLGGEITKNGMTRVYFVVRVRPDMLFNQRAKLLIECQVKDRRTVKGRQLMDNPSDWGFKIRKFYVVN